MPIPNIKTDTMGRVGFSTSTKHANYIVKRSFYYISMHHPLFGPLSIFLSHPIFNVNDETVPNLIKRKHPRTGEKNVKLFSHPLTL
jgi:hypothetical protein